jgi:amino acid transporter
MSVITIVALLIFGLLDLISVVTEIFGRRTVAGNEANPSSVAHRRRILLHLGMWVLIIGVFWAIVHFGPLRPVHEWLR